MRKPKPRAPCSRGLFALDHHVSSRPHFTTALCSKTIAFGDLALVEADRMGLWTIAAIDIGMDEQAR